MSAVDDAALDATGLDILTTAVRQAAASRSGADLDAALEEIGWADAAAIAPRAAVSSLFEAQGRVCSTSGALGRLLLVGSGVAVEAGGTALLPPFGTAGPTADRRADGRTEVRGLADASIDGCDRVVVVAVGDDGEARWSSVPTAALSVSEVHGLDPDMGLRRVEGTGLEIDDRRTADGSLATGIAVARLAIGHELVGTMRTMVDMARQHALDRVQFDRPIAGFQAVRHRLAEAHVATEGAAAALDGAWEDGSPLAASIAGAACGHAARTVRRHCQQVLAGIGFTTEHDLHRYVRRSIVLDGLLGDARTVTAQVGAAVLADGALPDLLAL